MYGKYFSLTMFQSQFAKITIRVSIICGHISKETLLHQQCYNWLEHLFSRFHEILWLNNFLNFLSSKPILCLRLTKKTKKKKKKTQSTKQNEKRYNKQNKTKENKSHLTKHNETKHN